MARCWVWVSILHSLVSPLVRRAGLAELHWAESVKYSMTIGPVWEGLIHATSCHLPPLPLQRGFALLSCLFLELADFYLLKRANEL